MALDLEARLRMFLASAPQTVYQVQTLQISHSDMSQVWHLWREPYAGQTTPAGSPVDMTPANIEIELASTEGHLDQRFEIRLGLVDAEDLFRAELDRIPVDTLEKIVMIYREYLSDELDAPLATATLQVESISYTQGAASFSAVAPRLNVTRTGELYTPRDIPMLRGFL